MPYCECGRQIHKQEATPGRCFECRAREWAEGEGYVLKGPNVPLAIKKPVVAKRKKVATRKTRKRNV